MGFRLLGRRSRPHAGRAALLAAIFLILLPLGPPSASHVTTRASPTTDGTESAREIAAGTSVGGEFHGQGSHLFELKLAPGQYVRVVVEKGDLQLSATLLSADRRQLSEQVGRRFGALSFSFIAGADGPAYLRLESLETDSDARRYDLRFDVRGATAKDEKGAAASRAYSEAEALRAKWDQASLRAAIVKYSEALAAWAGAGDTREQARTLRGIGDCYFILSEYREALNAYTKALSLSRSAKDRAAELDALNDIGYIYVYLGEKSAALRCFEEVRSSLAARPDDQSVETRRRRAQMLNNEGEFYYSLSEFRKALDHFARALAAWEEVGDRGGEGLAHLNLGYAYTDLGDLQNASEHYRRSLALWQAVGDSRGEALTRTAIGGLHTFLGERQAALDCHRQAMRVFQALGNAQGEAAAWNGIGLVYEYLNQPRAALDSYRSALQLYERIGNRDFVALSQYYVGRVYQTLGDSDRALEDYVQSMRLSHEIGDQQIEAHALRGVGTVYESRGQRDEALARYSEALKLYQRIGDRRWQARTLNSIGYVHDAAGDKQRALSYYWRALSLSRAVEDRREEVSTLYNVARAERDRSNLDEAIAAISDAVGLVESLRLKVAGEQLRTSYFASVHQYYELYIDLLMRAHKRRPDAGFAAAAFQASERARARSLLERLAQQEVGSGPGQELLGRERALWQRLDFKLESQAKLLNGPHTEEEAATGAAEIRALTATYQETLDRIQRESPLYASMTQTQLLSAEGIQAQVREDTVLLEYALGEERSYVWAVSAGSIDGYELPPRASVEGLAQEVYGLLTARQRVEGESAAQYRLRVETSDAAYWPRAAELSRMLLGPVASRLAGKRLLVVPDGVLHRIPFDALPEPDSTRGGAGDSTHAGAASPTVAPPLVVGHEVVTAPSASVLSALQNGRPAVAASPHLIAVLADPVFDSQDSRTSPPGGHPAAQPSPEEEADLHEALRDVGDGGDEVPLPRLTSSLREARAIADLTPPDERVLFTGFDANLEKVTGGSLGDFRIIHFATHGIFNDERPELSGLVLSRVDERGERRNGFLRTEDIYNLHLNADLVVLSACRTGLGHNVNGEGILGITRGFMYAGSRSIIASLWKVNDEATAELMGHFYHAMFRKGLPPSAALRDAKEQMWRQERWRSPYFWAAFVMQGEGTQQLPAVAEVHNRSFLVMAAALSALAAAGLLTLRSVRRHKAARA